MTKTLQNSIIMESEGRFNLYEFHKTFGKDIQVSYKGPFDEHILSVIGNYIKIIIGRYSKVSKKIFSVFIELAQNIAYYSAEINTIGDNKESGIGTLVIGEFENYFNFVTGNLVRNEDVIPIIEKCEIINSLDREGLRRYKREQRKLPQGVHGGAHIGLIQVALTSANPLDFEVTSVDGQHSFFSISVKIDK